MIFISHREIDVEIAAKLVDWLLPSLPIDSFSILCTSVSGHKLKFGQRIESQLKENLQRNPVLFALVTREALDSAWVKFELGAAWALDLLTIPILGKGVDFDELPPTIASMRCISADESENEIRASLNEVLTSIREKLKIDAPTNSAQASKKLDDFIAALKNAKSETRVEKMSTDPLQGPEGFALQTTAGGANIFVSKSGSNISVCPNCWTNDKKTNFLQKSSDYSCQCYTCKSQFLLAHFPNLYQGSRIREH